MSRQSSLVEDRISSDEDEFQEERTGTSHSPANTNGLHNHYSRANSMPTTSSSAAQVRLDCHMDQQTCSSSLAVGVDCPTKRGPPEPDLIREILARRQGEGINLNSNLVQALKSRNTHVGVRESRSTPTLLLRGIEDGAVEKVARGRSKKRKRFKLRSCLIRSCISRWMNADRVVQWMLAHEEEEEGWTVELHVEGVPWIWHYYEYIVHSSINSISLINCIHVDVFSLNLVYHPLE